MTASRLLPKNMEFVILKPSAFTATRPTPLLLFTWTFSMVKIVTFVKSRATFRVFLKSRNEHILLVTNNCISAPQCTNAIPEMFRLSTPVNMKENSVWQIILVSGSLFLSHTPFKWRFTTFFTFTACRPLSFVIL